MNGITGATVLVTGGTGSFGQTMARRLLDSGAGQVRILSRDEAKQDHMRRVFADSRLRFHLGDVRDYDSVERACRGARFVFHAAALKQAPACEFFPLEAVRTNVHGSANVIDAARAYRVETVVMLSTDKAVYPVNAMGMSKALMEKVAQADARENGTSTIVCCVRYGNVLYSRGSVVPLFVEQVKAGRPLPVTDPAMTRFLLSLDDAVGLVEHAFTEAMPGDVFVRKAPACTVAVLAHAVGRLFDREVRLHTVGTRHGEKLYETLVSREEAARAEDQGHFWRIPLDARDLNYELYLDRGDPDVATAVEYTSHNTTRLATAEVTAMLAAVPEIRAQLDGARV